MEQADHQEGTVYNVFVRWVGQHAFNLVYGGDLILDFEDAVDAFYQLGTHWPHCEYFIGAYVASSLPEEGGELTVSKWFAFENPGIGPDQGEQKIIITYLE